MPLDTLYSKMQARWPLTWKPVGVRPCIVFKYNIYALGNDLSLSESEVAHGYIDLRIMDWFETQFEQISRNVANNAWISRISNGSRGAKR